MSTLNSDMMLRYLYKEMSAEEGKCFSSLINSDSAMMDQYVELKEGFDMLDSISFSPSHRTVDRIKAYASIDGMSMQ